MPSPLPAVGTTPAPQATTPARPATAGRFQDALAAALHEGGTTSPSVRAPGSAPATVPLARMLAVMAGGSGAATSPLSSPPLGGPFAASAGSGLAGPGGDGAEVVETASRYLGIPYRWGGSDPATGLDCSGLVQQVFDDLGVSVPRTSAQQSKVGAPVPSLAEARPGDLLFWASSRPGQSNHIGIYVGDGEMLHAPYTGEVVKVSPVRTAEPTTIRRVATT